MMSTPKTTVQAAPAVVQQGHALPVMDRKIANGVVVMGLFHLVLSALIVEATEDVQPVTAEAGCIISLSYAKAGRTIAY